VYKDSTWLIVSDCLTTMESNTRELTQHQGEAEVDKHQTVPKVGWRVVLSGLVSRSDLNDKSGIVVSVDVTRERALAAELARFC